MSRQREKITYRQTYKSGAMKVSEHLLPERLPYFAVNAKLVGMEVRAAGHVEVDGEKLEFQDVRVYVRMPPEGGAA